MNDQYKENGVTLVEILLVLVIIASILIMSTSYMTNKFAEQRREKAVTLMQRTLVAGMAYYNDNGKWPGCSSSSPNACNLNATSASGGTPTLQDMSYLPNIAIKDPWGGTILYSHPLTDTTASLYPASMNTFLVCIDVPPSSNTAATAQTIAGALPMGFVTSDTTSECLVTLTPSPCSSTSTSGAPGTACRVVASTTVPGQNLNNARSLNFANVYHNGACVPAPACPSTMKPAIFVVPASVTGNWNGGDGTNPTDIYPLSSFTAYAVGDDSDSTDLGKPHSATDMPNCTNYQTSSTSPCETTAGNAAPAGLYWRVCLDVVTENGRISLAPNPTANPNWNSASGTIMAVTRCVPNNEPAGSDFQYFLNK